MAQLTIADGRGRRSERVAGVEVVSSGGVPVKWAAVAEMIAPTESVLDYGSWQGIVSLHLAQRGGKVVYGHHLSSELVKVRENAKNNKLDFPVQAMFLPAGTYDTVVLAAPPAWVELLAAQAAGCIKKDGRLLAAAGPGLGPRLTQYYQAVREQDGVFICTQPKGLSRSLPWQQISIDVRGLKLTLSTLPLLFSPGGLDAGSRFMLEEAEIPAGSRVLDLGCGYGAVGLVTDLLGAGEVVYVDDDLAALVACDRNLAAGGQKGELVHSHNPEVVEGKFDVILTNPPYHADFGVARSFLEFAARRLKQGGWLYVVVKRKDWYENKLRSLFGGCKARERDGYWLLAAQRREQKKESQKSKGTRKHLKRQQRGRR